MSENQFDGPVPPIERSRSADNSDDALLPPERSQFNRRLASFGLGETPDPLLASFGLGETPDPLLTRTRPPAKQRADG